MKVISGNNSLFGPGPLSKFLQVVKGEINILLESAES